MISGEWIVANGEGMMKLFVMIVSGIVSGVAVTLILRYMDRKKQQFFRKKLESLQDEKKLIAAYSKKPIELVQDSFRIVFYLFFLVALANVARLFHGLLYDDSVVWQQFLTEGGVWLVIILISLQYHRIVGALSRKGDVIEKINQEIETVKLKISEKETEHNEK